MDLLSSIKSYILSKNNQEAIKVARDGIEKDPTNKWKYYYYWGMALKETDADQSLEKFSMAGEEGLHAEPYYQMVLRCRIDKSYKQAYTLAMIGKSVPKTDVIWEDVYNYLLDYQISIIAYYVWKDTTNEEEKEKIRLQGLNSVNMVLQYTEISDDIDMQLVNDTKNARKYYLKYPLFDQAKGGIIPDIYSFFKLDYGYLTIDKADILIVSKRDEEMRKLIQWNLISNEIKVNEPSFFRYQDQLWISGLIENNNQKQQVLLCLDYHWNYFSNKYPAVEHAFFEVIDLKIIIYKLPLYYMGIPYINNELLMIESISPFIVSKPLLKKRENIKYINQIYNDNGCNYIGGLNHHSLVIDNKNNSYSLICKKDHWLICKFNLDENRNITYVLSEEYAYRNYQDLNKVDKINLVGVDANDLIIEEKNYYQAIPIDKIKFVYEYQTNGNSISIIPNIYCIYITENDLKKISTRCRFYYPDQEINIIKSVDKESPIYSEYKSDWKAIMEMLSNNQKEAIFVKSSCFLINNFSIHWQIVRSLLLDDIDILLLGYKLNDEINYKKKYVINQKQMNQERIKKKLFYTVERDIIVDISAYWISDKYALKLFNQTDNELKKKTLREYLLIDDCKYLLVYPELVAVSGSDIDLTDYSLTEE